MRHGSPTTTAATPSTSTTTLTIKTRLERILADYPDLAGIAIWSLGGEGRRTGRQFVRRLKGARMKIPEQVQKSWVHPGFMPDSSTCPGILVHNYVSSG